MGRGSVVGPALGGIVVIPLKTKVAAVAGLGDVDRVAQPCPFYVVAIAGTNAGTAGTNIACDDGAVNWTRRNGGANILSTAMPGPHMHTNEGVGEASITPAITGFLLESRVAAPIAGSTEARFVDRSPSAYPGTGRGMFLAHTGIGVIPLECTAHLFIAPAGHIYEADQPSATNSDPLYFSVND